MAWRPVYGHALTALARDSRHSTRAALIYLHSSAERQRAIADQVSKNAKAAPAKPKRSGMQRERDRGRKL